MAIKEELVPFPYSFECRLEKNSNIKFSIENYFIYRSDECFESFLCCDRLLLLYAFDHRSLLFGRVDVASKGGIVSGTISRAVPFRFVLQLNFQ
jgi:hypothetical protein